MSRRVRAKILYLPNYDRENWGGLTYAHDTDSAFDLRACEDVTIGPMERALIPLGFKLQLESGFGWTIRNRSSTGAKLGLSMANGLGTIDNGFQGEPKMCVINLSDKPVEITRGMRIGQAVIEPIYQADFEEVESEEAFETSTRGSGSFGSSGKI